MNYWVVVAAAITIAVMGYIIRSMRQRNAVKHLEERTDLTDEEIFQRFYAPINLDFSSVIELWKEIATNLKVPAGRMRPDDKFGTAIGAHWITSEELDVLSEIARKRAEHQGKKTDLATIKTVDEYIRYFAEKDGKNRPLV